MSGKFPILIFVFLIVCVSCNQKKAPERTDTMIAGVAKVAVDETFLPFMKEEASVFMALNKDADIRVKYTTEADAFDLLFKDSLRLIVAARNLTLGEKESLQKKGLLPRSTKAAVDGIALIVNKKNLDTLITVDAIKNILSGKILKWNQLYSSSKLGDILVVFDNAKSSTVRYMQDSIVRGNILSPNVYAQQTNEAVIDFVAKTPNAVGIIGVNWINNPNDTTDFSFNSRIRVMSVSPFYEARDDNSYLPYPGYLALKKYPLSRDIYMIITDVPGHLPSGFMNFVCGEHGQRLILKLGLLPANSPMRIIQVNE